VRDERTLARIRALAIPPAWSDVWIAPSPHGHLQATGRDARGRKQYRYHPEWRARREAEKFDRLVEFGRALPRIRRRVRADLRRPGLPRERVLAALVALLDRTRARIGNEEYTRAHGSFGLATLRSRHVRVGRDGVRLEFRGKAGTDHRLRLADPRLARIVRRCKELPGQRLFQYVDDGGRRRSVGSADVNAYLREAGGADWSSKEFRTWHGSVEALAELRAADAAADSATESAAESRDEDTARQRAVAEMVERVARRLRNTRTVCRKHYIHPRVLEAFLAGELPAPPARLRARGGLSARELDLLRFLESDPRPASAALRAAA
jgi:DNA topoisomerase-1